VDTPKVCIIGSLRFYRLMLDVSALLTEKEIPCFLPVPGRYRLPENPGKYVDFYRFVPLKEKIAEENKRVEAHLEKGRNTNIFYLVCPGGYVGTHTIGEIYCAHNDGKPIYASDFIRKEKHLSLVPWIEDVLSPEDFVALLGRFQKATQIHSARRLDVNVRLDNRKSHRAS